MAFVQTQKVSVGDLLSGTFYELAKIRLELVMYFGAFLALGLLADLFPPSLAVVSPAALFGYFVGQYYLYQALLSRSGLPADPKFKVFRLIGLAVMVLIPVIIGLNFFYLPGILIAARLIIAPTILVGEERGVFDAMSDSWHATNNNGIALSIAFGVLTILWTGAFVIITVLGVGFPTQLGFTASNGGMLTAMWLGLHGLPVILMGLSFTAYRALSEPAETLAQVFE